jgi:peptide/nickel transport system permease protein
MLGYIVNRILLMIPTLLGVAIIVFLMLRVMPGDIVALKLKADGGAVTQEVIEAERTRLGLNKSLPAQLADWLIGLVTLDFGKSMWTGQSVAYEISIRFALSLEVAILAALIAVIVALPLGTLAALHKDSWVDYVVRIVSIAGLAVPSFWPGMLVIMGLLTYFDWLPPITFTPFFQDPWTNLSQLIWPATAIGYRYSAVAARMTRSTLIEVLQEDYIRTTRAKGLRERVVVTRHAMRNALLPVVTVIGLEFAFLIGGLVVTEQVFNLNGIGKLFVEATTRGDYTMVQALVMLIATFFIVINFAVDLLYAGLDPRIRYG